MVTKDPRVDAYVAAAPTFAKPILIELRARMHAAAPDVRETIKWRIPAFEARGLLAGMAGFKAHATFGFWRDKLLRADSGFAATADRLGRMTDIAELPTKAAFAKAVRQALVMDARAEQLPRGRLIAKAQVKPKLVAAHPEFARALAAVPAAKAAFAAFAPGYQLDYLEWIADAKRDDTRLRRIEQAIDWIAAGKHRNWRYERD
jgi:hypothetical protein